LREIRWLETKSVTQSSKERISKDGAVVKAELRWAAGWRSIFSKVL